jgi:uncharacterized protein YdhG (YjbR/CyaY superfamily)
MSAVDDYLDGVDPVRRAVLDHVRHLVKGVVPDAEEATSYGMPAFKHKAKPLLGLVAAKEHLSLFPFSPRIIDEIRGQLEGFSLSKGTIRFTAERPIPDEVVRDIARRRVAEIG